VEASTLRNRPPPERATVFFGYMSGVVAVSLLVTVPALLALPATLRTAPLAFWLMAVLAVLGDARPFLTSSRSDSAVVLPSVCFSFAILLDWGLPAAVVVQSVAVAMAARRMRHTPWRAAFNGAQYVLCYAAAAAVLSLGSGLPLVLAAAAVWFVVNNVLVSTAVWLRFGATRDGWSWWRVFTRSLRLEVLSTGALLLLGPILAAAAQAHVALVPLVSLPLFAVERMAHLSVEQERQALRDPLTGLPNRKAVVEQVEHEVAVHAERAAAGRVNRRFALLLIDLDRFKHVNDALGHAVGDRLLGEVARRLHAWVRADDLVARLGGDEFAVVAPGLVDASEAKDLAYCIADALSRPVPMDGLPLDVAGSIGVAVYPEHGQDYVTLMRHADVAMYEAKHRGDSVALYQPESDHNNPERLGLLADLRKSLESPGSAEITMYYQPQVSLDTGAVVGVEALLRWQHPRRGMVNPEELIRVAEHTAVMRLLTRRVVDDVVAQVAKWATEGLTLRAALNVSVRDLHNGDIVDQLAERLTEHQVPPEQILLEITEGALMADPRRVLATIVRLERLGVAISLDDFGTGYSSLQHLRRLPLAEVKVDRSFVLGMSSDADDAAIVRSTVELARALGLRVVAEGVEDERTWRQLCDAGCHVAQGWFFARPMPGDELAAWLARYRPLPATRRR